MNEDPSKLIDYFDDFEPEHNRFRFLSNFYAVPGGVVAWVHAFGIELRDYEAVTTEHIFQAAKATNVGDARWILDAPTPGIAKKRGRGVDLIYDWEEAKFLVMRQCLAAKFPAGESVMSRLLLATGDAWLVEGNSWGDDFWGVDMRKPDRPGLNWLGHLLMARRAELSVEL